jgi:hypothetical protein
LILALNSSSMNSFSLVTIKKSYNTGFLSLLFLKQ